MARKSDKNKSKKSPDKSPRRVGRPPRRRKKSDSESSEDKKTLEANTEVEQGESSESGRMRRSTRRQAAGQIGQVVGQVEAVCPAPEPKPSQSTSEWKEDESFWAKEGEATNPIKEEVADGVDDEGGTVWKVQTSNGSGGEIQKLRICRQRPAGTGSDSADSSMSPAKDSSSPLHKSKILKKDSQKSPLVESSVSEIELPPSEIELPLATSEIELPQTTAEIELPKNELEIKMPPDQPNDVHEPEAVQEIEIQLPEVQTIEIQVPASSPDDDFSLPEVQSEIQLPPSDSKVASSIPQETETNLPSPPPTEEIQLPPVIDEKSETPEERKEAVEIHPAVPESKQVEPIEENEPVECIPQTESQPQDTVRNENSGDTEDTAQDKSTIPDTPSGTEENKSDEQIEETPVTDIPPPPVGKPDKPNQVEDSEHAAETNSGEEVELEMNEKAADQISSRRSSHSASIEIQRESDSSVKSGGSRRSSESDPASNESNEPLLEISPNKSPSQDGKEEGEIVDDEKTDTTDQVNEVKGRVVRIRTKSEESTAAKITTNRRSTGESTASHNSTSKPGSKAATTAKKHPLITGPEPDESPAVRRRKLSASLATTTRTVITPGGTTRQVRSIPGEALKALLPEAEKKEKTKSPRTKLIKIKSETDSRGAEKSANEIDINKVEDIREILKSNRAAEKKSIEKEKEAKVSMKSPLEPSLNDEIKIKVTRKVSIGAAPPSEEVKTVKPTRSKSPGDTKATPTLFVTNLVRPFTAGQLKELLARTGTIAPNGFFIDKIKSKCFVKYVDVEMAIETRHALNGVRWPVSNPKVLKVAYATDKELKTIQESADGEVVDDICSSRSKWLSEQAVFKDRERRKVSVPTTREWDMGKPKSGSDGDVIFVDEYKKEKEEKANFNRQAVIAAAIHNPMETDRNERHHERDKMIKEEHPRNHSQVDRDKRKRRPSAEIENSPPPPARKFKKKDYDAPAKLLDDLFRKTKTSPCLYWLPLSAEQISIKEETRRKHMAEHVRRMAELKKSEQQRRDKERDRDRERRRK